MTRLPLLLAYDLLLMGAGAVLLILVATFVVISRANARDALREREGEVPSAGDGEEKREGP